MTVLACRLVIGALLAGGAGSRLGRDSKPAALLAGRSLASYPAQALAAVCERVAVVCKRDTVLPELPGIERWDEPDEPRHPLTGIIHALERGGGPVLVCAADMPFVTPDACRTLMHAAGTSPAVVATAAGLLQPTLTRVVEALDPVRVALPSALVRSVNTPDDLADAEAALGGTPREPR